MSNWISCDSSPRLGVALRVARHPRQARARAGAESRHRGNGGARRACGDGPVVGLVAQQCAQIRTVSDAHPKVPVAKAVNQRHDHTVGLGNPQGDAQGLRIMVDPRGDRMPYRRADRRQHGGQVQRPAAYGVAPPVAIPNGRYRLQQFVHARDFSVHVFHSSTVRRKRTRLGGILGMIVRYHGRLDFQRHHFGHSRHADGRSTDWGMAPMAHRTTTHQAYDPRQVQEHIVETPLNEEMSKSFLEYAYSVIYAPSPCLTRATASSPCSAASSTRWAR